MRIQRGCHVVLRYELFDSEGELLESSEDGEPMEYTHGADEIAPALERALVGKGEGERVRVTLPPAEAFGVVDPGLIIAVPRAELPDDVPLMVGEYLPVALENAPEDLAEELGDEEVEFRIVEVGAEEVVLDANHPLAGKTITFVLEVASVT
jgi:FKBP-type peptidyl-prolyl cis-trans isomerase 2